MVYSTMTANFRMWRGRDDAFKKPSSLKSRGFLSSFCIVACNKVTCWMYLFYLKFKVLPCVDGHCIFRWQLISNKDKPHFKALYMWFSNLVVEYSTLYCAAHSETGIEILLKVVPFTNVALVCGTLAAAAVLCTPLKYFFDDNFFLLIS